MTEVKDRMDPDFEEIIKLCRIEMEIKFPNYGNIWTEQDDKYFKERLRKEVNEYVASQTVDSERRKLINVMNIACMAWQTAMANRSTEMTSIMCTRCGKDLRKHMVTRGMFNCNIEI